MARQMSVHDLDVIQHTGAELSRAVDALDRTHLRALADRFGLSFTSEEAIRISLKRHLVDAGGHLRK